MRIVAGILVLVTLLVGAFLGYCYYGAQMEIESVTATLTPATDALGTYNEVLDQLTNGTFMGTQYRETEFIMAENFAFLTLMVRMSNKGMLPQDWIQIEVQPDAADVLQLAADRTPTLSGNSRAEFSITLLTRTGVGTDRKITVTYYVLGRPFTVQY